MLDTLVDLFEPIWVYVMGLGVLLGIYGVAAFFISIGQFWEFLTTRNLKAFQSGVKFLLFVAPFAFIMVINRHDRYVTCEREFDQNEYSKGRYIAQEMKGKLLSHNCVSYRQSRNLAWRPKNGTWND